MSRGARWVFTHNNADDGWRPIWDPGTMEYLIWEVETAPTTGRRHVQGYVRMKERRTLSVMKIILNKMDLHLETAKGSEKQNKEYCTKDVEAGAEHEEHGEYRQEQGARNGQGKRTDLEEVATAIGEGMTLKEVALKFPHQWIKYHSGLTSLHLMTCSSPPTRRTVTTTILWGASGVGKSHRVRTTYPEAYVVLPGRDPFSGYTNQEVVIFEEFDPHEWPIRKMNILLDVWAADLDSRYYNKKAWWKKVFILSNSSSTNWYSLEPPELITAFKRRISYEIEITSKEQELLLI